MSKRRSSNVKFSSANSPKPKYSIINPLTPISLDLKSRKDNKNVKRDNMENNILHKEITDSDEKYFSSKIFSPPKNFERVYSPKIIDLPNSESFSRTSLNVSVPSPNYSNDNLSTKSSQKRKKSKTIKNSKIPITKSPKTHRKSKTLVTKSPKTHKKSVTPVTKSPQTRKKSNTTFTKSPTHKNNIKSPSAATLDLDPKENKPTYYISTKGAKTIKTIKIKDGEEGYPLPDVASPNFLVYKKGKNGETEILVKRLNYNNFQIKK